MNNSAAKVGEIFREAGTAFTKLSEMTLMLQPTDDAPPGSKWSEEEVEMLRGCVNRFAVELNKISIHIKNRTMRHLRTLLDMDTGNIHDIGRSQPRQQQLMPQPLQPTKESYILEHGNMIEAEAQLEILFPKDTKNKKDDVADLLHFNPGIVPLTPPANFMQEDTISQQAPSEFDNTDGQSTKKNCHSILTELISVQDSKYSHCTTVDDSTDNTCSTGTLYAELVDDPEPIGFDINNRSIVTKKGHFTWSQATKTWECATTTTSNSIESEKQQSLYTTHDVQTTCNIFPTVNEEKLLDLNTKQYRPQLNSDPVPGAFTSFFSHLNNPIMTVESQTLNSQAFSSFIRNDDPFKFIKGKTGNIFSSFEKNGPGDVKSVDHPFRSALGCVQAPHETTRCFSSIRVENNEQAIPSSAHFTSRSRRRRVSNYEEIEQHVSKKRKKATPLTTGV